jgi:N-acetyl-gamma-glutamyl-phosphate reductase
METIKAGIIGATGYAGSELVRFLSNHPKAKIEMITSESYQGRQFTDIHPQYEGILDFHLESMADIDKHDLDVVFLALPHGVSMEFVKNNAGKSFKIIDLSGDFRLKSPEIYTQWYQLNHVYPEGLEHAAFGLPELFKEDIQHANLVANPGCFPVSAILALAPLVHQQLIDPRHIIIDSKTGVSGAGVKPKETTHFSNVNDNFKAYNLKKHRHTIEIQSVLNKLTSDALHVQFTPHLLPVDRGIFSTCYAFPKKEVDEQQLHKIYKGFYQTSPFVRISQHIPSLKKVRGSNYCDIMVNYDERTNTIIALSAIDNLVKGAAGQAVENMNIMFGLDDRTGLLNVPLQP